jgi:hypothetical protein
MKLEDKLNFILVFQQKYPGAHVGGSIGLLLHGIDLARSLDKSDIDMTILAPLGSFKPMDIENTEESSHPDDFDYQFRHYPGGGSVYVKLDINVKPETKSEAIEYKGNIYNVSLKADILSWKQKYAVAGAEKHIDDLITIATGVRPDRKKQKEDAVTEHNKAMEIIDDLPF